MNEFVRGREICAVLTSIACALCTMIPQAVHGSDTATTIEITVGTTSAGFSDKADWGWWDLQKYDTRNVSQESGFDLVDARLFFSRDTYTVFLSYESYPRLSMTGTWQSGENELRGHTLSCDTEVFDFAIARWVALRDGVGANPWIGLTRMRIGETRFALSGDSKVMGSEQAASSALWGVALGADVGARVSSQVLVTGRVQVRWARGTRTSEIYLPFSDNGEEKLDSVIAEEKTQRAMYGVEAGLRWMATGFLQVEGGWRYRDWGYDDGLATFNGPFFRLIGTF